MSRSPVLGGWNARGWTRAEVDRVKRERVCGDSRGGRKAGDQRRSAQVDGWLPTAEGLESMADSGLRAALLTLASDRIPGAPEIPVGTLSEMAPGPWGGMSGAVVIAHNLVIGVVRSYNLAAGGKSLTVTPMTAIDQLPDKIRSGSGMRWGRGPDATALAPERCGLAGTSYRTAWPGTSRPNPMASR